MGRHFVLLVAIAAAGVASSTGGAPAQAAGIYQCRDADGRTRFQDRPCAAQESGRLIQEAGPEPRRRDPDPPGPRTALTPLLPAPAPVKVPPGRRFTVGRTAFEDPAWKQAVTRAGELPPLRAGTGRLTLIRVFLEGARSGERLQAAGGKLRGLGGGGGGGRYREIESGGFLVIEHLSGPNADRLEVGALAHGLSRITVPAPDPGTLGLFGDLVLARAPGDALGEIRARVRLAPGAPRPERVVVGPVTVGGPYGESFPCNARGVCVTRPLAPGSYRVLFPDFDRVKSRFTVTVTPGQPSELGFLARDERRITLESDSSPARPTD